MLSRAGHQIKEHLIPTKHNDHVPHFLRDTHVLVMLGLGIVLFSFVQIARVSDYFGLTAEVYPAVIVSLTNKDREKNDLPLLATNKTLEAAAKLKAEDMASKGYFAHTSPEGVTPWHWFTKAGYSFIYAGENLAVHYDDSQAVQNAWLDSPTHRANIMNANFTEMGVATAKGVYKGAPTTFVVEMFGMPATAKAVAMPAPVTPTPKPEVKLSKPLSENEVAGESVTQPLVVLEETHEFAMVQNNDQTLEPGVGAPSLAPTLSWWKKLLLHSDKIAGLLIEVIMVIAIITTAGMVAKEYEKRHKKHMLYGTLLAVVMFTLLFAGGMGVFDTNTSPLAQAMKLERTTQGE